MNMRKCSYCDREMSWTWSGKTLKDGSKVYLDEEGRKWSGRRCPECEKERVKLALRYDDFQWKMMTSQLEAEGYSLLNHSYPLKVKKDNENRS